MWSCRVLCVVALSGCMSGFDEPLFDGPLFGDGAFGNIGGGFGGGTGSTNGTWAVFDDGTTLLVTACGHRGVFGCVRPDPEALPTAEPTATLDGQVMALPLYAPVAVWPEESRSWYEHRLATPTPIDPVIKLGSVEFELMPPFSISARSHHVSRSAGPLMIDHEVLADAGVSAMVTTHCGLERSSRGPIHEVSVGQLVVELASTSRSSVTCTHEIRIVQRTYQSHTTNHPNQNGGYNVIHHGAELNRIEIVSITSEP